jgi:hypothetical protein
LKNRLKRIEMIRPGPVRSMNTRKAPEISQEEINRLAFLNWEKDGCPSGRDVDYWLEAEIQLKATWHLLVKEHGHNAGRKSVTIKLRRESR